MTDASKKKEEAKKNIRSLLQSSQGGRTLQELRNDFKDFFFSDLPGREFGYSSPEDFLKDIPDVCEISYSGGGMIFKAVASASTAHIQRLVSLNKPSSKKTRRKTNTPAAFSNRSSGWPNQPSRPPRFRQNAYFDNKPSFPNGAVSVNHSGPINYRQGTFQTFKHHTHQQQHHQHRPPPSASRNQARHQTVPIIPAFIQGQVREMLDSNPHGLPLTHFCRVFKLRFKAALEPSKMGFRDEHAMLASIPNIATLKQFPQGEVRVLAATSNNKPEAKPFNHDEARSQRSSYDVRSKTQSPPLGAASSSKESSPNDKPHEESPKDNYTDTWDDLFKNQTSNIPSHIQQNIQELIEKRPEGIYASCLASAYKSDFNEMLHFKSYGYRSVIDFVSDLSSIIKIERPNQGDWLLYPMNATTKPQAVKESLEESQCTFLPVEDEVKECICQVLGAHPSGILLDRFLVTFKEMTGTSLQVENYGSGTLRQFLHSLPDILNIVLDVSDKLKVCAKFHQGPRRFDRLLDNYRPTTTDVEMPEPSLDLPPDAVTPGCYYKPLPLPPMNDLEDNYVEVYVSFVIDPSCFWIQLRGERTTLALEELMDDLEKNYKFKPSKRYQMPPSLAKEGTLCAAIYPEDSFWYRAIILGYEPPLYKIYYVDYGNTCTVTIDNIQLLKRKFMKLPAQAIKARLSNIQPSSQKWSIRARDRMLELCREIPLIGLVAGIKDRTLSLCLTDTRGHDDIHINDMLVMDKHAKFVPDSQEAAFESHTLSQGPSTQMLFGDVNHSDPGGGPIGGGPVRRYVRQAQVNDDITLNLINLGGLHLLTAEISSLFFGEDIISSMLIKDSAKIQKVVLNKSYYPDLFHELIQYETPWVTESSTRLGVYPLTTLPLMIDLYGKGKDLEDLKDVVLEILDWFDPDDPYWKGEDENDKSVSDETEQTQDSQSVVSDGSDTITLEDLMQALNILQMKRKQVLRKIMNSEGNVEELVNELNAYELNIKRVEARKTKQEQESGQSTDKDGKSSSSKTTDETSMSLSASSTASASSKASATMTKATTSKLAAMTTTTAATTTTATTATTLPSLIGANQQDLLFNPMYLSSMGLMPNLSQSALHGLSNPAAFNNNLANVSQFSSFFQQPSGLTSVPGGLQQQQQQQQTAAAAAQLANLNLLANQNLLASTSLGMVPGVGRGVGIGGGSGSSGLSSQYPSTLTPTQMAALNQAMLASTSQLYNSPLYNSQLLSMSGAMMPQLNPGTTAASTGPTTVSSAGDGAKGTSPPLSLMMMNPTANFHQGASAFSGLLGNAPAPNKSGKKS